MVGMSERDLTSKKIAYEVGVAKFEELAKGQMLGLKHGFLKIIFCPKTRKLLGVHAIGEYATEIIHIGQVLLSMGGSVEYFRENVFNYPTFAEVSWIYVLTCRTDDFVYRHIELQLSMGSLNFDCITSRSRLRC
jgi:pyruvate/2-oxoglutarate dehydrogenase complex dihydrolipoamide dehydrogenase (E3) component